MIQDSKNTAAIAAYVADLLNMGYDRNGMCAPETLATALKYLDCSTRGFFDDDKIYYALASLNYAAYSGRYGQNVCHEIPAYEANDISEYIGYSAGHFVISEWHFRIYKMIQFYNYQCDEDATRKTDLLAGMKALEMELAQFIIANSDLYRELPWG
jgi:hypothetical protein